jgi:hypothetical protein
MIKAARSTERPRVIPSEVIAGLSTKLVKTPVGLIVTNKLRHGWKITINYPSNIKLYTSNCTIA